MNYYILFSLTVLLLFLIYTPGVITLSFSRINTVFQITFIPFIRWNSATKDIKGANWFGTVRVLGGKAVKYGDTGIEESFDSIDYLVRILGFEFEYIVIKKEEG